MQQWGNAPSTSYRSVVDGICAFWANVLTARICPIARLLARGGVPGSNFFLDCPLSRPAGITNFSSWLLSFSAGSRASQPAAGRLVEQQAAGSCSAAAERHCWRVNLGHRWCCSLCVHSSIAGVAVAMNVGTIFIQVKHASCKICCVACQARDKGLHEGLQRQIRRSVPVNLLNTRRAVASQAGADMKSAWAWPHALCLCRQPASLQVAHHLQYRKRRVAGVTSGASSTRVHLEASAGPQACPRIGLRLCRLCRLVLPWHAQAAAGSPVLPTL